MVATFGSKGKGLGEFDGPYMMSFRKQGGLPSRLLVADYGNNRVQEVGFMTFLPLLAMMILVDEALQRGCNADALLTPATSHRICAPMALDTHIPVAYGQHCSPHSWRGTLVDA